MQVQLQLQLDAALDLQNQQVQPKRGAARSKSGSFKLKKDVEKLGLKLEPIHPGQTNPLLAPYFMIEVPDRETAERVISLLTKNNIVEAAYLQPEDSLP